MGGGAVSRRTGLVFYISVWRLASHTQVTTTLLLNAAVATLAAGSFLFALLRSFAVAVARAAVPRAVTSRGCRRGDEVTMTRRRGSKRRGLVVIKENAASL